MDTKTPSVQPKTTPPQPFFEQLQQEMERMLDRIRGYPRINEGLSQLGMGAALSPAIDMAETDDTLEITAEIPGVSSDDLDVSLNGDVLVIKGEKSQERTEDEKDYHLHERSFGSFRRQMPLGFTPADDAIDVTFADGVLKLTIAKPAEAKTTHRKIPVKSA
ncbi:Hsp20/alpha crystallin family protein [Yoonia sediminilitoris]|uniref:HSP20 family protein n=1 Tax=Yoonia sediminilitoris TaxID=1286148 RepID=A0A2T6KIS6_9RHOB|nr:Hsp20/alpha crystallin family protein [Yoonia sediminilitoris]PUB15625.1 HSP20 family protein [Yoonia sediminilitoris]RCW96234.1 HSP20 family protein [Yoonia sediminilitoris]